MTTGLIAGTGQAGAVVDAGTREARTRMCMLGEVTGSLEGEARLGWRRWALENDDGGLVLVSPYRSQRWPGPELMADRMPELDDTRGGIHAWFHADDARRRVHSRHVVTGLVSMAGKLVVHKKGYRAERARIVRLELGKFGRHGEYGDYCSCTHGPYFTEGEMERVRAMLGRRYGCDVDIRDRAARRIDRAGMWRPGDLLPSGRVKLRTEMT